MLAALPIQADSARPDSRRPGNRDNSVKISPADSNYNSVPTYSTMRQVNLEYNLT